MLNRLIKFKSIFFTIIGLVICFLGLNYTKAAEGYPSQSPNTYFIYGYIANSQSGEFIPDADIYLEKSGVSQLISRSSNEANSMGFWSAVITGNDGDVVMLDVHINGFTLQNPYILVLNNNQQFIPIPSFYLKIQPTGTASINTFYGKVVDSRGEPIVGAQIRSKTSPDQTEGRILTVSGENGLWSTNYMGEDSILYFYAEKENYIFHDYQVDYFASYSPVNTGIQPLVLYPTSVKISGIIKNYNNAVDPLSDVKIEFYNSANQLIGTSWSNATGYWQSNLLPTNQAIKIVLSKTGWIPLNTNYTIYLSQINTNISSLYMRPIENVLEGYVKEDSSTAFPVQGAIISITGKDNTFPTHNYTTDKNGYWMSSLDIPRTEYTISVSKPNYTSPAPITMNYTGGIVQAPCLYLKSNSTAQTGRVSGYLLDKDNNYPIPEATVELSGQTFVIENRNGYFYFENIASGSQQIKITAKGFNSEIQNITVTGLGTTWNGWLTPDGTMQHIYDEGYVNYFYSFLFNDAEIFNAKMGMVIATDMDGNPAGKIDSNRDNWYLNSTVYGMRVIEFFRQNNYWGLMKINSMIEVGKPWNFKLSDGACFGGYNAPKPGSAPTTDDPVLLRQAMLHGSLSCSGLGQLKGRVTGENPDYNGPYGSDGRKNIPLQGAILQIAGKRTVTDVDGNYSIPDVPVSWKGIPLGQRFGGTDLEFGPLVITKNKYPTANREVVVYDYLNPPESPLNLTTNINLDLDYYNQKVGGTIKNDENRVLPEARVNFILITDKGEYPQETITDENGVFGLKFELKKDEVIKNYKIEVARKCHAPLVKAGLWKDYDGNIILIANPIGGVEGSITNNLSQPVPAVTVSVDASKTYSNSAGFYVLRDLASGEKEIKLEKTGYEYPVGKVTIPKGCFNATDNNYSLRESIILELPANNSETAELKPTFTWKATPGLTNFKLFINDQLIAENITEKKFTLTEDLGLGRAYNWRVESGEGTNKVASYTWYFKIIVPTIKITSPKDGEFIEEKPTIRWTATEPLEIFSIYVFDYDSYFESTSGRENANALVKIKDLNLTSLPKVYYFEQSLYELNKQRLMIKVESIQLGFSFEVYDSVRVDVPQLKTVTLKTLESQENENSTDEVVIPYVVIKDENGNIKGKTNENGELELEIYAGIRKSVNAYHNDYYEMESPVEIGLSLLNDTILLYLEKIEAPNRLIGKVISPPGVIKEGLVVQIQTPDHYGHLETIVGKDGTYMFIYPYSGPVREYISDLMGDTIVYGKGAEFKKNAGETFQSTIIYIPPELNKFKVIINPCPLDDTYDCNYNGNIGEASVTVKNKLDEKIVKVQSYEPWVFELDAGEYSVTFSTSDFKTTNTFFSLTGYPREVMLTVMIEQQDFCENVENKNIKNRFSVCGISSSTYSADEIKIIDNEINKYIDEFKTINLPKIILTKIGFNETGIIRSSYFSTIDPYVLLALAVCPPKDEKLVFDIFYFDNLSGQNELDEYSKLSIAYVFAQMKNFRNQDHCGFETNEKNYIDLMRRADRNVKKFVELFDSTQYNFSAGIPTFTLFDRAYTKKEGPYYATFLLNHFRKEQFMQKANSLFIQRTIQNLIDFVNRPMQ